jgi:hypothetical protein
LIHAIASIHMEKMTMVKFDTTIDVAATAPSNNFPSWSIFLCGDFYH